MGVDVTPDVEPSERRALLVALELVGPRDNGDEPFQRAWRVAALREGVDGEAEVSYAFSPRSTRGATRA